MAEPYIKFQQPPLDGTMKMSKAEVEHYGELPLVGSDLGEILPHFGFVCHEQPQT